MSPDSGNTGNTGLDRGIGLPAALAIGIGTMVGAGIFVFPGLVAQRAGELGLLSFLVAGVVALVVAFYTSELATSMPQSGGGYAFTRQVFGRFAGATVGMAQWAGLVFASAFYLASFGTYTGSLLGDLGIENTGWVDHLVPATALALTAVNTVGSQKAGKLQKYSVFVLTAILVTVFIYGLVRITVFGGGVEVTGDEERAGLRSVVTTAAMIFTAFIGFVQIATVGGEIKNPRRNLPLALMGSVVIVLLLYLLVYYVSFRTLGISQLAGQGETGIVKVAERLLGGVAATAVLAAGVLATLSSANASVLSSSRTLFALSRDGEVPAFFSRIWSRYRSPYNAVVAVGLPAAGLSYFAVERLAEIASLLHLVVYGLICLAIAKRRWQPPEEYQPPFRARSPGWLALAAGLACFGLISFMTDMAIIAGMLTIGISAAFHFLYTRLFGRKR